jgi:hypothetical protein
MKTATTVQDGARAAVIYELASAWTGVQSARSVAEKHVSENFKGRYPIMGSFSGREGWIKCVEEWQRVCHPVHVSWQVPGRFDNQVVYGWTSKGTFSQDCGEFKAHGKQIKADGISLLTFDPDNRLVEEVIYYDSAIVVEQMKGINLPEQI